MSYITLAAAGARLKRAATKIQRPGANTDRGQGIQNNRICKPWRSRREIRQGPKKAIYLRLVMKWSDFVVDEASELALREYYRRQARTRQDADGHPYGQLM